MLSLFNQNTIIAGVGNPFRRDDGFGCEVIRLLRLENNHNFVLVDCGTDGLALLDRISGYAQVVIIDAVRMRELSGVIKVFSTTEAKVKIKSDVLSTHGLGLAEMLKLIEVLDIKANIKIIGIQPKDIGFGEGFSDEVKNQIPQVLNLIKQIVL